MHGTRTYVPHVNFFHAKITSDGRLPFGVRETATAHWQQYSGSTLAVAE